MNLGEEAYQWEEPSDFKEEDTEKRGKGSNLGRGTRSRGLGTSTIEGMGIKTE